LYNKYILVKDNANSDTTPYQDAFEKDFNRLNYETYEIEYLRGYNNGDAHFLKAVKGRYILRLKSEVIDRDAHYVINYCSKNEIKFREIQPSRLEETRIMQESILDKVMKLKSSLMEIPSIMLDTDILEPNSKRTAKSNCLLTSTLSNLFILL